MKPYGDKKTYEIFTFTILAGILPFLIVNVKLSQTCVKNTEFTLYKPKRVASENTQCV